MFAAGLAIVDDGRVDLATIFEMAAQCAFGNVLVLAVLTLESGVTGTVVTLD